MKPDEGTQGDGIFIVTSLDEVLRRMNCIRVEAAVRCEIHSRRISWSGWNQRNVSIKVLIVLWWQQQHVVTVSVNLLFRGVESAVRCDHGINLFLVGTDV